MRRFAGTRIALAATVALVAAAAIALVADGDRADGEPAGAAAGKWRSLPPSPLSRTEVGAARIGGSIYVVGGFAAPDGDTVSAAVRYEIAGRTWEPVAAMPVGVNHPAVAAHGGRLYVHGGYTGAGSLSEETDALQRFDPRTGKWSLLAPSGFPRAGHVLAAVRGSLYAIGGAHQGGRPLRLVQAYDPLRNRWRAAPKLRVAREHLAGAVAGGTIYALGGRAAGENVATVEILGRGKLHWKPARRLRVPRSGFGAAVVAGRVIAVGGEQLSEGDSTIAAVEIYLPGPNRWKRLPRIPTPRHGLGVVAAGRTVFALEGGPRPGLTFSGAAEAIRLSGKQLRLGR